MNVALERQDAGDRAYRLLDRRALRRLRLIEERFPRLIAVHVVEGWVAISNDQRLPGDRALPARQIPAAFLENLDRRRGRGLLGTAGDPNDRVLQLPVLQKDLRVRPLRFRADRV